MSAGTRFEVMPGHQCLYFTEHGWGGLEGLRSKAKAVGQSMIRLALDWAIHQPGITSVLIGARSTSHLDQALDAAAADIA